MGNIVQAEMFKWTLQTETWSSSGEEMFVHMNESSED